MGYLLSERECEDGVRIGKRKTHRKEVSPKKRRKRNKWKKLMKNVDTYDKNTL
jgi:hypothetical protein